MRKSKVTSGGQMTLPAEVRRRWSTRSVLVEDAGDHVIVRPAPDDVIAAARGALKGKLGMTSAEMREQGRREDLEIERRKWGRLPGDDLP